MSPLSTWTNSPAAEQAGRGITATKRRFVTLGLTSLMAVGCLITTGCFGVDNGYSLGWAGYPMPVSPYFQRDLEERFWDKERYDRVPILGPVTAGGPPQALDPPSDDEVMRALEEARPVNGGIPLIYEKQRNNVRIIREKIADYVDPPRHYPLVGPAQLHHAHYKCTIYFDEKQIVGYPIPHTLHDRETVEVVYIDHNHLHMVGDVEPYQIPNL